VVYSLPDSRNGLKKGVECLVGIDVGTTMTKAAVVGLDGVEFSNGAAATPWQRTSTGAEVFPEGLWQAAMHAVQIALAAVPSGRVVGLGVTSIAETVVLLGKDGMPVANSIAWHDTRGGEEAVELVEAFGRDSFVERTGLSPSAMCTLCKLAWLCRHVLSSPPARALCVADWLVQRLGGEQIVEASLASRTGALSLATRSWWTEGLEWAGVPAGLFPSVVGAGERVGTAAGDIPKRLEGAALASAGHDHLCVAAGVGAIGPGQLLDDCGTAEAMVRAVEPIRGAALRRAADSGVAAGWHTLPGKYALLQGQSLGLVLGAVLELLGVPEAGMEGLDEAAAGVLPGTLRLVRDDPHGPAALVGIEPGVSPAAFWSAALEEVCDGAHQMARQSEAFAGPVDEVVLTGGWSHCAGLRERKRQQFPRVTWPVVAEAGARGAALFGGCAARAFSGPEEFPTPSGREDGSCRRSGP
jgi:sugar (pentulose or hexulose) kinase